MTLKEFLDFFFTGEYWVWRILCLILLISPICDMVTSSVEAICKCILYSIRGVPTEVHIDSSKATKDDVR